MARKSNAALAVVEPCNESRDIKNKPNKDSVDIITHFKLRADITLESLSKLIQSGKVIRNHISGARHGYVYIG